MVGRAKVHHRDRREHGGGAGESLCSLSVSVLNHTLPLKLAILLLTLLLATTSCKRSEVAGNQNGGAASANSSVLETSRTPPFQTKEPERYQAVRVTTYGIGNETNGSNASDSFSNKTFIAHDGERRREDYEMASGVTISLLQLPGVTYVLLPEKKIYAECKPDGSCMPEGKPGSIPPDFSPDRLLNAVRPEAHYEKLGPETINGRATTKYRVTLRGRTVEAKEVTTESLIWVDEALGMPVKTEIRATGGAAGDMRFTEELRDIKETVDPGVFDLPEGYRKVDAAQLNLTDLMGKGRE